MKRLFTADFKINSVYEIDFNDFKHRGFNYVLLDVDNTLVPPLKKIPDENVFSLIKKIKDAGIIPIIASNNTTKRVNLFCKDLDIIHYSWSFKPLYYAYLKIIFLNKIKRKEIFSVGDQIVTDVFGSKKIGIYSVLTKPLSNKEGFSTTYINRKIERFILKYILHE